MIDFIDYRISSIGQAGYKPRASIYIVILQDMSTGNGVVCIIDLAGHVCNALV